MTDPAAFSAGFVCYPNQWWEKVVYILIKTTSNNAKEIMGGKKEIMGIENALFL